MTSLPADIPAGQSPLNLFNGYVSARQSLLSAIGRGKSNRDPLAEWTEWLAENVMHGTRASNPVQADYDIELADGTRVQTKYLANPSRGDWINWRYIAFSDNSEALHVDLYALLVVLDLRPAHLLVFHRNELAKLYDKLGKRHAGRGDRINFTKRDYHTILCRQVEFRGMVDVVWADEIRNDQRDQTNGTGP